MHSAFPQFTNEIAKISSRNKKVKKFIDKIGGKITAEGMSTVLKILFSLTITASIWKSIVNRYSLGILYKKHKKFFVENMEILDPSVDGGKRYYQGKILFRTDKEGDDMNVLLKFCPEPDKLYKKTIFGRFPDPGRVISTEVLDEKKAARIEKDPDKVDVVIYFKDVKSLLGMKPDMELTDLLLNNLMHIKGNVGHLFKFGSIATNIKLAFGL